MDCNADLMASDELINIREMSKRSSVPAATLRYYEKLGLITSERETSGSHHRYSESTFHRIIYITLAQRPLATRNLARSLAGFDLYGSRSPHQIRHRVRLSLQGYICDRASPGSSWTSV